MMSITEKMAPRVLDGRLALVTGAGQGNGRAIALGLARAGASVVATDVDMPTVQQTAADIKAAGGRAWSYRLDVTNAAECTALAATVAREVGRIDLLVNNAGIVIRETFDHADAIAHAKRTFQVNVEGTLNVTHAWLADLRATKGCIVNLASIGSFVGLPGVFGYSPSKGAIKMLTQSLAGELAKDGVRVNAIAPAVVATAMTTATRENPERLARFLQRTPLGRVAEPEELVGPVVFLASDMASYITGVTLPVDGGYLAV